MVSHMIKACVAGALMAVVLIATVIALGMTFGQRCAVDYTKYSSAWHECVQKLAHGKP